MTARWEAALDAQLEWYQWSTTPMGMAFTNGYAASIAKPSESSKEARAEKGMADYEGSEGWASVIRQVGKTPEAFLAADTFFIAPEMWTLAQAAVEGWKAEPLVETDLLSPSGFLLLPEPLELVDVHGKVLSYRAFWWHPLWFGETGETATEQGTIFFALHKRGDPDEYDMLDKRFGVTAQWLTTHVGYMRHGYVADSEAEGHGDRVVRQLQALWRLMAQTIVIRSERRPSRDTRRRLARAKLETERVITVVELRRPHDRGGKADGDTKTVEWTHRWLVAGHWRNQWFPSLSLHRQIWIHPFIKGPADAPLEVRKFRVFELVR